MPTQQPSNAVWEGDFRLLGVKLIHDAAVSTVQREITYKVTEHGSVESFVEDIFPIYVPPTAQQTDTGTNKPAGGPDPVATTDTYWAKAAEQARSTAKWIATVLGAALAAIIGTAPLSPLGGKDIDWVSVSGALIGIGLLLLGVTILMVLAVLVPGVTMFSDLMKPISGRSIRSRKLPMSIPKARETLARHAADKDGVQLPIGIHSLNELGRRIRIDEMTLSKIAEKLAQAGDDKLIKAWTAVKTDRGQWLQSLINEATQWVIVGSYVSVKVKSDRARSVGLLSGIAGGALLVIGYIGVQTPAQTQDTTTYVVLPSATTSDTRKALGASCDVFTAVPLATDQVTDTVTLYVTGGKNCMVNIRVELPAREIASVTPGPTPTS